MQMIHAKFLASDSSPNGAHRPNERFFSLYQSDKYLETEYKLSAQELAIANAKLQQPKYRNLVSFSSFSKRRGSTISPTISTSESNCDDDMLTNQQDSNPNLYYITLAKIQFRSKVQE